jgi:hypothetical protein
VAKKNIRDLVVILPGITGSVLSSGSTTGEQRDLWNLSGQTVSGFLWSRRETLHKLTVAHHDPCGPAPESDVVASGLIYGFHGVFGLAKIDGYGVLRDTLTSRFDFTTGEWSERRPANLVAFPYDWRLSNRAAARVFEAGIHDKLAAWRDFSGEPEAKVILIAHSMGGLVARYWLEVLDGWRDATALITFGTPYRGSVDALGYLANGYKKTFLDLTEVLLSCPSVYELLPIYRSIRDGDQWYRPSEVSLPVISPGLQALADEYIAAAAKFHDEIRTKVAEHADDSAYQKSYTVVPFVGVHQKTAQSASLAEGKLTMADGLPAWIEDDLEGGDGTVPRLSAIPIEMDDAFGVTFLAGRHSGLQSIVSALDDLVERLRQSQSRHMRDIQGGLSSSSNTAIDLVLDDAFLAGEDAVVRARLLDDERRPMAARLRAVVTPTDGRGPARPVDLRSEDEYHAATVPGLPPGQYRVAVEVVEPHGLGTLPIEEVFEMIGEVSE